MIRPALPCWPPQWLARTFCSRMSWLCKDTPPSLGESQRQGCDRSPPIVRRKPARRLSTIKKQYASVAVCLCTLPAHAGEWDISAELGYEARAFLQDPPAKGQFSGVQNSLILQPDFAYETDSGANQFSFVPFARLDARDNNRTHWDVREAYWRHVADEYDLLIGLNTVFWGVTESRHLVNIINQIDAVENIDEEDFLGQPMIQLGTQQDFGRFDLYVLPGFRERTFPSREGRLTGPFFVADEFAAYESGAGEHRVDVAARYSHYVGNYDFAFSLFHGTSREAAFRPLAGVSNTFRPYYEVISQAGLELQYTGDALLLKLEAIGREGSGDAFAASVAGFEYTFYQIADSDMDLGVLGEYLYDGREEFIAPITIQENDVFAGARLTFNDAQDTAILAGALVDVEDQSTSLRLEAERRLGNDYKVELQANFFVNQDPRNLSSAFADEDFMMLRLSRFF